MTLGVEVSDRVILVAFAGGAITSGRRRDGGLLSWRWVSIDGLRGSWLGLSRDFSSLR